MGLRERHILRHWSPIHGIAAPGLMPTSVAAALPKTCSSMPIQLEKGTPMPSGGFLLRYVGCFGGPERVDRSKIEIGLAFVSRGLGGVSQCPQGAARLDLEAEPAGSRLAQFLS